MDSIYLVTIEHGDFFAFEDGGQAEQFAGVRGGATVEQLHVQDEASAKRLIDIEAKERRDEERFDRMRDEGEI